MRDLVADPAESVSMGPGRAPRDRVIPCSRLEWNAPATARFSPHDAGDLSTETLSGLLARVLQSAVETAARERTVSLVSLSIDATDSDEKDGTIVLHAGIDRQTRTLVFAHGQARQGERQRLRASAIYRLANTGPEAGTDRVEGRSG